MMLCILSYAYFPSVYVTAAAAKLFQSRLTLCDPMEGSPLSAWEEGSSVPGIFRARTLGRVAISFPSACMQSRFSYV